MVFTFIILQTGQQRFQRRMHVMAKSDLESPVSIQLKLYIFLGFQLNSLFTLEKGELELSVGRMQSDFWNFSNQIN